MGSGGRSVSVSRRIGNQRNNRAASGKAKHPDTVRIDLPFAGAAAHQSHGAIGILAYILHANKESSALPAGGI